MPNSVDRARELFSIPTGELPAKAKEYAQHMCRKYGMCGEVLLTAFAHYAELAEGCEPSPDPGYRADSDAREFFGVPYDKWRTAGGEAMRHEATVTVQVPQAPRAYTRDEAIEALMTKFRSIAEYWATTNLEDWRKPLPEFIHRDEVLRRCMGTAFTMLSSGLDGAGDLPGIDLVLCPHEDDLEYRKSKGENWFEPEMRISTALHEHFHIKTANK